MTCNSTTRLTIGNSASYTGCSSATTGVVNSGCNTTTGVLDRCDRALIGPRTNRDNVRQRLHDYVILSLGAPVIELELDEQAIDMAISEALNVWEDYAPRDFYTYYTFVTTPGKSVYTMPPEVGWIRNVYYKETATLGFQSGDLGGVIPLEYMYPGSSDTMSGMFTPTQPIWGKMGEWSLYKQYEDMYARLSSNLGGWEFVDGNNNIKLFPIPCNATHAIVHYLPACPDVKYPFQSIREGVLAKCKMMIGEIRGKFQTIPGPNGGTVLNGEVMYQRGRDEWDKWEERLITRYGDLLIPIMR